MELNRSILYVNPEKDSSDVVGNLESSGWRVNIAADMQAACEMVHNGCYGVGLTDVVGEISEAFETGIEKIKNIQPNTQWIALVANGAVAERKIVQLISDFFYDYHTLPVDLDRLLLALGHAQGMYQLIKTADEDPEKYVDPSEMAGVSNRMMDVFRNIRKLAEVDAPVIISGESGTGKELAARAIHHHSRRQEGPFVPVNCAGLPPDLIQAELFGYEKGAFTDARTRKAGCIEVAAGGTLFLDEIGDLTLPLQVNLLRFLQEHTIRRLGSTLEIPIDLRVIAATHVDLEQAVENGLFREDLYYRLNVLLLKLPPLRERIGDIQELARFYFNKFSREKNPRVKGFSRSAFQVMDEYPWPGNVREMINRVRRAMVMCDRALISPSDLGLERRQVPRKGGCLRDALEETERAVVLEAINACNYNLSNAARALEISRPRLYRLVQKHELFKNTSYSNSGSSTADWNPASKIRFMHNGHNS